MVAEMTTGFFRCLTLCFVLIGAAQFALGDTAEKAEAEHGAPAAHGSHDSHGEGHAEGGHDTSVPLTFQSDLALWSLITFLVFLFVMKKLAWSPLISGLDQREAGIRAAIAQAEENQRKSHAMLAEYESKLRGAEQTVADMVAEAKRDAERTSRDIAAKAQADVDAMRVRAKAEIAQAKDTALHEVFQTVNAQVASATERVLGRALSDQDQDRLIQEALAEISG
ncbi:MAG: F0F1 ATP synthase subunit B [Planctomycetaceae bacterium]